MINNFKGVLEDLLDKKGMRNEKMEDKKKLLKEIIESTNKTGKTLIKFIDEKRKIVEEFIQFIAKDWQGIIESTELLQEYQKKLYSYAGIILNQNFTKELVEFINFLDKIYNWEFIYEKFEITEDEKKLLKKLHKESLTKLLPIWKSRFFSAFMEYYSEETKKNENLLFENATTMIDFLGSLEKLKI